MTSDQQDDVRIDPQSAADAAESDWEYDQAHEGDTAEHDPNGPESHPMDQGTYVATETPEFGGDYGYDMAHDIPGR